MAIIKAPKEVKVQEATKSVTLDKALWAQLADYAKYAGIKGTAAAKVNYIVGEALKNVFENDKEFNAPKAEVKAEAPAQVPAPKTAPTAAAPTKK